MNTQTWAQELAIMKAQLDPLSKFSNFDLERRFIWTCYRVKTKDELTTQSNLVLPNRSVCLCSPGGEAEGVGLQVTHVPEVKMSGTHFIYQEINMSASCHTLAAYTE